MLDEIDLQRADSRRCRSPILLSEDLTIRAADMYFVCIMMMDGG
jgi:hypothetical protein